MKLKRRILSVLLTLAVMVTFMPFVSQQAFAASSSKAKVQVVTKAKANNGNTSYTYNKKGLITKAVTKTSSKSTSEDTAKTVTTTYKYNKKNKVSKKTTTIVEKVTRYETDKTTGKTRTANLGTVTTTDKYVTVYTYNKKGLATKSVTTATTTKSGTETSNYKNRSFYYNERDELTDGRIIAGYNYYDATGKSYDEDTSANAYYYTGAVNTAVRSGTDKYTYRDNGNGTYSVIYDDSTNYANYNTKVNRKYYMYDDSNNVVECTEDDYWDFNVVNSVEVVLDPTNDYAYTNHSETTYKDQTVTTTKYTYKKGRVSKAVSTSVSTFVETDGVSSYTDKDSEGTYSSVDNSVDTDTTVTTYTTTTTYSYDKKGRAKQSVVSNNGVENSVRTIVYGLPNRSWTNTDGTKGSEVGSGASAASTTVVQVANGTKTTTYTPNKYMRTYTYSDGTSSTYVVNEEAKPTVETSAVKATPSKSTYKYTYDKNGNLIRQDCKATNTMVLEDLLREQTVTERGKRYTINMTIQPTYLYMLSEPDLNNPTVTIN